MCVCVYVYVCGGIGVLGYGDKGCRFRVHAKEVGREGCKL